MTEQNNNTSQAVLVAIDVAKAHHDLLIRFPSGKKQSMKIHNTHAGFEALARTLEPEKHTVVAAVEPTADYHRLIAHWLHRHGVEVHLASSLACARAREMLYKSWDKHDRKDATVILYLMEQGMTAPFHDPLVHQYMDIQELSNSYHQISLARSRCFHSLVNHYLTLYFPEMERYLHNSRSEWFCRLMLKYPTPISICTLGKSEFVEDAWEVVGRKVAKQRFLEELYAMAGQSIGLPVDQASVSVQTFRLQLQRYLDLTQQRQALEQQAQTLLATHDDYPLLQLTVPP